MWRKLAPVVILVVASCGSPVATPLQTTQGSKVDNSPTQSASASPSFPPPTDRPQVSSSPFLPLVATTGGDGAATVLVATSECSKEKIAHAIAPLRWTPAVERGDAQLVEITIYSFEMPGSVFSERLEPTADHWLFDGLSGQAIHNWRVLTQHGDVWASSVPGQFVGATCTADG